jgi:hypothetical protein
VVAAAAIVASLLLNLGLNGLPLLLALDPHLLALAADLLLLLDLHLAAHVGPVAGRLIVDLTNGLVGRRRPILEVGPVLDYRSNAARRAGGAAATFPVTALGV